MSSFDAGGFGIGCAITFGATLVLFLWFWLAGIVAGRVNVVDVAWGAAFAVIAAVTFGASHGHGCLARQALVLVMVAVWGLRLSTYIGVRSRGKGEDPRYADLLERASRRGGHPRLVALRSVFLTQAITSWVISLPVQVAAYEGSRLSWPAWIGIAVWALGVFFESVGDAQMAAFRRNPDNRGKVMDRGLWHYTRHPNYFGDACVWVGLWVVAAQQWQGLPTVVSAAVMVWFLAFKTGKPLLEKQMAASKPGYAEYMQRTSGFVPLPPRRPQH